MHPFSIHFLQVRTPRCPWEIIKFQSCFQSTKIWKLKPSQQKNNKNDSKIIKTLTSAKICFLQYFQYENLVILEWDEGVQETISFSRLMPWTNHCTWVGKVTTLYFQGGARVGASRRIKIKCLSLNVCGVSRSWCEYDVHQHPVLNCFRMNTLWKDDCLGPKKTIPKL